MIMIELRGNKSDDEFLKLGKPGSHPTTHQILDQILDVPRISAIRGMLQSQYESAKSSAYQLATWPDWSCVETKKFNKAYDMILV